MTSKQQSTIISELRKVKSLVEETATSLRSQREILKKRGMNLPPMVMQSIASLTKDLATLETDIFGEQTELGQLRFLVDTSSLTNSSLDLDTVLEQAIDVVINLTNAERGYLILVEPETGELHFRVTRESDLTPKQGSSEAPQISQTILRDVVETGEPLLADNAYKDERLQSGMSIAAMTLRSVLCVPLKYKDEIIGVVYVDNRLRSGVFEEREKNLMLAFANQAAVAIENARLYERIQHSLNEIREVKELLDSVFASIGSGVITANYENNIMDFNRAAGEILQRDVEQALGAKLATVLSGVSADLEAHLVSVRENRNSQVLEAEMEIGSRGRVALNMKVSPLQDKVRGTQGIAMVLDDVTAQRGREEMLTVMKRYLPPEMVDNIHTISKLDLGGVRHEVTCMFVDVRPVDTFPEGFRPQQIMEELNIYFARATDVIHAAKGVIDKYMGTEIMALFNTQLNPMPNHAQIALEVALSIREALTALYDELGIDPQPHYYRVGIHSGVATLGNVGSMNRREFTAIGDTINLTKRLEENASAGQIIVSEHLQQKLVTADVSKIRFEERDPLKVKGRQQKTRIYEVFRA
jgi:adenylate cyclase